MGTTAKDLIFTKEDEILVSEITKKTPEYLAAYPEINITPKQKESFRIAKRELKRGIPLAYVLGYKWFYGYKFKVNKHTLIPRPETELLVDRAGEIARARKPRMICDIGTGSGAIIVSLKKSLKLSTKTKFMGVDISVPALNIAKQNARILKAVGIEFKKGNLLEPLKLYTNTDLLILANLPYLSKKQLLEPSIKKEPKLALYGGKDPLQKIERLLKQAARKKISRSTILLEINYDQAVRIKKLAKKYWPASKIRVYKDLGKHDRLVEIAIY